MVGLVLMNMEIAKDKRNKVHKIFFSIKYSPGLLADIIENIIASFPAINTQEYSTSDVIHLLNALKIDSFSSCLNK